MRLIHTADWHLGRYFHEVSLAEDQAYVLAQFVELVAQVRPAAVIVAGDVYDRAVPPPEAVRLLDETMSAIVRGLRVSVVMIAGNHDSPARVEFGARILDGQGLHVFGMVGGERGHVGLTDGEGPLHVYAVPYADPPLVRQALEDVSLADHDACMRAITARIRRSHPEGERGVLVAHAFVSGGAASESERPLSVGGASTVDPSSLAGFDYVALGHLHRPQSAAEERIQYSGSLLKYSFSEADHVKSVSIVEIDRGGGCRVERVPLSPRRDVRRVEGTLEEVLARARSDPSPGDYLSVTLTDRGPLPDAMARLREVHPQVLELLRPALLAPGQARGPRADHRTLSDIELFEGFVEAVSGEPLAADERESFARVVEAMDRAEREAGG